MRALQTGRSSAATIIAVSLVLAGGSASGASPGPETYDQRIARRIATIDQKTYETHRRCYGWQQGIFDLLTRLKPYVTAADAQALDTLIAYYAPTRMYGVNERFLSERTLPLDKAAGDRAWGSGILEWNAQRLLPPDEQYAYYGKYGHGQPPPECAPAEATIEAVRTLVWNDEFARELYGKDFLPAHDPR
jgi:hypothetical protein